MNRLGIWLLAFSLPGAMIFAVWLLRHRRETLSRHGSDGREAFHLHSAQMRASPRAELEERVAELEESNARLEEFALIVAHDMKEPLQTVETFSSFLLEDYVDRLDAEGVEYLEVLKSTSARMRYLIGDLLQLASIHGDAPPFMRISTRRLLEEIRGVFASQLHGVDFLISSDLPDVKGSKRLLTELFGNLISNALKHNDKAVRMLRIGHCRGDDSEAMVTVFVQDNGNGIDPRDRERIFGGFLKASERSPYEVSGAGLALCRRIIERHGGRIWVESEPGEGSTFFFTIPRARE